MSRINVATRKLMENFLLEAFYKVVPVVLKAKIILSMTPTSDRSSPGHLMLQSTIKYDKACFPCANHDFWCSYFNGRKNRDRFPGTRCRIL